jgi:integrase
MAGSSPPRVDHADHREAERFNQACLDVGVSFVLYDLRHTFATGMLTERDVGADLATIAVPLGHSGLRVVAKYLDPQAETRSEAMKRSGMILRGPLKRVK